MANMIKCWWMAPEDGKLAFGDNRIPVAGDTHTNGKAGFFAGPTAAAVLRYAHMGAGVYTGLLWHVELHNYTASPHAMMSVMLNGDARKYLRSFDTVKVTTALAAFAKYYRNDLLSYVRPAGKATLNGALIVDALDAYIAGTPKQRPLDSCVDSAYSFRDRASSMLYTALTTVSGFYDASVPAAALQASQMSTLVEYEPILLKTAVKPKPFEEFLHETV